MYICCIPGTSGRHQLAHICGALLVTDRLEKTLIAQFLASEAKSLRVQFEPLSTSFVLAFGSRKPSASATPIALVHCVHYTAYARD